MIRWANQLLLFVNVLALFAAVFYFGLQPLKANHDGIEYKDLVTIILAAVAVVLAAVTLFVAVMAIWGYNSIREESVKAAVREAVKAAEAEAKNTAQVVASREAVAMLDVLKGDGKPEAEDELAAALRVGAGPDASKP